MSNRYIGGVVTETTNVAQSPWSGSWTEQAAMQGFGSVLRITNSLRFRSSASAYLSRTPASAGNQQTWTWSGWVKRGSVSANGCLFAANPSSPWFEFYFHSSGSLYVQAYNGSTVFLNLQTTPVYRDPSAWYHIVLVYDATNATASNRVRLYVNNVQVTAFGTATYPSQNTTTAANGTVQHAIGGYFTITDYFDGYMAEINFIDGQALEPTAFGAINKETGVWAPIAYAGTYGLNGFHLDFKNGTSTTTLGYDTSGNGNNWTTNNISLTAGSTYDWMIDSPSKIQGTGYGVGNYAVLNPVQSAGNGYTLSNANLTWSWAGGPGSFWQRASISVTSGKWYWETVWTDIGAGPNAVVGIQTPASASSSGASGDIGTGYGYYCDGTKYTGTTNAAYGASWTNGDVIGVAFDADAGTLTFYKNNVSQGTAFTGISGAMAPVIMSFTGSSRTTAGSVNFGQRPFAYTPPTGYQTLCTQNLPVATIYNGAAYMAATLWTGNGATQSIANTVNGVSFQPDLVWGKSRSNAYQNILVDVIRGASTYLQSSTTAAEATNSSVISAFTSTGFTVGSDATLNGSGTTDVAWQWKAGGTAVTNTAGSITSSVSANTTAGFSVVTYTGNGTASTQTIGHGLSSTLSMLILKGRASSNDMNWGVSHTSIAAPNYLILNLTVPADNHGPGQGQPSIGTGNTFKVLVGTSGTNNYNTNGATYVAYCFAAIAGYSAFGSYTGNGSSDGPFVYCGFRPRYVLIKRTDSTGQWAINDSSRNPYNVTGLELFADLSDAESNDSPVYDFLSNGFKIRNSYASRNASGGTYIYAAFAENPFSVALAR